MGVFFLIVDMFKDKSGRKKHSKHPTKTKRHHEHTIEDNAAAKKKKRRSNDKGQNSQE
jgi:hypothetical protein